MAAGSVDPIRRIASVDAGTRCSISHRLLVTAVNQKEQGKERNQ
jgi:hypothetical protein